MKRLTSHPSRRLLHRPTASSCLALTMLALACSACDPGALLDETGDADPAPSESAEPDADNAYLTPDPIRVPWPRDKESDKSGGEEVFRASVGENDEDDSVSDDPAEDPAKILEEAEILRMVGDTAFVLSEFTGLHILDLQDPTNIKLLDSFFLDGTPHEMYVDDRRQIVIMLRGLYEYDEASQGWREASSVLRLDARVRSDVRFLESTRIMGRIIESRRRGELLEVVSYEDGRCFGCEAEPQIRVSSLRVNRRKNLLLEDEEIFAKGAYMIRQPSAYFSGDDVFVTVPEIRLGTGQKGRIVRASMSDGTGDITPQPSIFIEGWMENRLHMNVKDDVLRVFSRDRRYNIPPMLETFRLTRTGPSRLSALQVQLPPKSGSIHGVHFDGDRAFVTTHNDPVSIFTFDLSEPTKPKQVGTLKLPGRVFHMETRGDRLLSLGYSGNEKNRLGMTLMDVSDLEAVKILSSAEFGGPEVDFRADLEDIHEGVQVLDERGMILVPYGVRGVFGGNSPSIPSDDEPEPMPPDWTKPSSQQQGLDCGEAPHSAIQIFDWSESEILAKGAARIEGSARRSLLLGDRLIAMSDDAIATFDIQDHDAPKRLDQLGLAIPAQRIARMGDYTIRFSDNGFGGPRRLDVLAKDDVQGEKVVSTLSLGALSKHACSDGRDVRIEEMLVHGHRLYLAIDVDSFEYRESEVVVVDFQDLSAPVVLSGQKVEDVASGQEITLGKTSFRTRRLSIMGDRVVHVAPGSRRTKFSVFRIDDKEGLVREIELEREGFGGELVPAGDELGSWHKEDSDKEGYVKFFYDRFFVDENNRFQLQEINVPGVPLGMDSKSKRLLTVDFEHHRLDLTRENCEQHVDFNHWDWKNSVCVIMTQHLHEIALPTAGEPRAKVLSRHELTGEKKTLRSAFLHEDRLFMLSSSEPWRMKDAEFITAGFNDKGELQMAKFPTISRYPRSNTEVLNGAQIMEYNDARGIQVIDARDLDAMVARKYKAPHRHCDDPQINDTQLQCPMGRSGVRLLDPLK